MLELELGLTWAAVVAFVVASVAAWIGVIWRTRRPSWAVLALLLVGLLLEGAAIVLRWARVGHGPYVSALEVLSSSVWVGAAVLLVVIVRRPDLRAIAGPALGISVLLMGWGMLSAPEVQPLPPTFRGVWLVIHIAFAKLAYGSILVATGVATHWLLRSRRGATVSELASLDELAARLVTFAFVACTFMIAAGALWAQNAWGRYWAWDPIETWALATWLLYGLFLHLRLAFKMRGQRSAWAVLLLLGISIVAFFVIARFLPTVHTEFMVGG